MSQRRFLLTNPNAEDARSSLEDDRLPSYTFIDTMALTHPGSPNDRAQDVNLLGPDFVMLFNETEFSLASTLGIPETSDVATPPYVINSSESSLAGTLGIAETSDAVTPRYGKRPSAGGKFMFSTHFSIV